MQLNFILRSLALDVRFLTVHTSFQDKVGFLFKKYMLLIRNFIFGVDPGKSKEIVFGKDYYYDDVYGIAYLQSLYVDNAFLKKYISPNATIIDIGANIGQFNFFCKHYLKARKIYSIEPVKKTYTLLQRNVKKDIFQFAISSHSSINLFIPSVSLMASSHQQTPEDTTEIVKGIKLDTFVRNNKIKHIDLLKIDTEGSEYDVLLSGRKTLQKAKYILIEASGLRDSEGKIIEICSLLNSISSYFVLIYIGRIFIENNKMVAVYLLFCQSQYLLNK